MASPFHVERFPIVEWQLNPATNQFVNDDTIVDTMHRDQAIAVLPIELRRPFRLLDSHQF